TSVGDVTREFWLTVLLPQPVKIGTSGCIPSSEHCARGLNSTGRDNGQCSLKGLTRKGGRNREITERGNLYSLRAAAKANPSPVGSNTGDLFLCGPRARCATLFRTLAGGSLNIHV
ncbi:hypothetical protein, partial [Nitrosococcus oceani]|uniref:hypothetical protein n=1 Tax=Nitrosococcus oceani TaxID=1229 RepID=UPI001E2A1286